MGENPFVEANSASGRASAELVLVTGAAEGKKQCFVSKISKLCGLVWASVACVVVTIIDEFPVFGSCCADVVVDAPSDGNDSFEVSVSRRGGNCCLLNLHNRLPFLLCVCSVTSGSPPKQDVCWGCTRSRLSGEDFSENRKCHDTRSAQRRIELGQTDDWLDYFSV